MFDTYMTWLGQRVCMTYGGDRTDDVEGILDGFDVSRRRSDGDVWMYATIDGKAYPFGSLELVNIKYLTDSCLGCNYCGGVGQDGFNACTKLDPCGALYALVKAMQE